ncbi:winged helix-turn-helix domain-containing protein [Luteibacter yeojuensis]|uniref:OmpR/PhoB-type domain-containing protein n=1 Tax=Luteibacter yeojuensis TaxID=345309 RepID=A0A7X5QVC8_9GAMM|nr:hypothetical protein [Luteibacter yeojuensis]
MKRRRMYAAVFRLGDWTVRPALGVIERHGERIRLEPKLLDVLVCLAERPGDVVGIDQLLDRCWAGDFYGDNPVHKTIAMLRRALGDDARSPYYIATIRKRGYRLLAPVVFLRDRPPGRNAWLAPLDHLLELARAMDAMGRVLLRMGRIDVAAEYFDEAIELRTRCSTHAQVRPDPLAFPVAASGRITTPY